MKPAGHFANGPTGSGSAISVDQKALDMVHVHISVVVRPTLYIIHVLCTE